MLRFICILVFLYKCMFKANLFK
ncbi:hypothetical protein LSH36_549g01010 [Paralvinella palmiformis]|uniref:Uncharacterized protein n=1 Tax=Paralvinella palmiformis TaxID=53620 RepID=A0AAD9J6F9_9ANNE|nr:hypothetical protein LSH36_549g01010 [Paralvinella palmiformis]